MLAYVMEPADVDPVNLALAADAIAYATARLGPAGMPRLEHIRWYTFEERPDPIEVIDLPDEYTYGRTNDDDPANVRVHLCSGPTRTSVALYAAHELKHCHDIAMGLQEADPEGYHAEAEAFATDFVLSLPEERLTGESPVAQDGAAPV